MKDFLIYVRKFLDDFFNLINGIINLIIKLLIICTLGFTIYYLFLSTNILEYKQNCLENPSISACKEIITYRNIAGQI